MSNSFISGQPSVQGEENAPSNTEQQPATDMQEYNWNLVKVSPPMSALTGKMQIDPN